MHNVYEPLEKEFKTRKDARLWKRHLTSMLRHYTNIFKGYLKSTSRFNWSPSCGSYKTKTTALKD